MNKILDGLKEVVCLMNNVLVFGSNQAEHDQRLIATLERIEAAGVTLNKDKCKLSVNSANFWDTLSIRKASELILKRHQRYWTWNHHKACQNYVWRFMGMASWQIHMSTCRSYPTAPWSAKLKESMTLGIRTGESLYTSKGGTVKANSFSSVSTWKWNEDWSPCILIQFRSSVTSVYS